LNNITQPIIRQEPKKEKTKSETVIRQPSFKEEKKEKKEDRKIKHKQEKEKFKKTIADLTTRIDRLESKNLNTLSFQELEELESLHHDGLWKVAQAKMEALQREMEQYKHKCTQIDDERSCSICQDKQNEVVTLPCRHLCMCNDCAAKVDICPLCRIKIAERISVFIE